MTIAIIRVRGVHGVRGSISTGLKQLHLTRKNHCVLVEKTEVGLMQSIRDYATWGEVSQETITAMEKHTGEKQSKEKTTVFRLNNPKGGWKNTRTHVPKGDLGYRGEKINDLIKKMLH